MVNLQFSPYYIIYKQIKKLQSQNRSLRNTRGNQICCRGMTKIVNILDRIGEKTLKISTLKCTKEKVRYSLPVFHKTMLLFSGLKFDLN